MTQPLIITAHTLRDMLTCQRLVWLDQHGDPAAQDPASPMLQRILDAGIEHEQRVQARTAPNLTPLSISSWADGVEATEDAIRRGAPVILGACIEHTLHLPHITEQPIVLRGRIDRLERGTTPDGLTFYWPVEIKQSAKSPKDSDRVQMALYLWMLALRFDVEMRGQFWMGRDENDLPLHVLTVRPAPAESVRRRINDAVRVLAAPQPEVRVIGACKDCHWNSLCMARAVEIKDLGLVHGLRQKTRANLEAVGITSLSQLADMTEKDLRKMHGVGVRTSERLLASARAWVRDEAIWMEPLGPYYRSPGLMFDIETHLEVDPPLPWCFGWMGDGDDVTLVVVHPDHPAGPLTLSDGRVIEIVPHHHAAWRRLAEDSRAFGGPVYHWGGFDSEVMRITAPDDAQQMLGDRMRNLHKGFTRSAVLPRKSTGLKAVSTYLGYPWHGYQSAFSAYDDYLAWMHNGDLDALTRACLYQEEDVRSLRYVWRWLFAEHERRLTGG